MIDAPLEVEIDTVPDQTAFLGPDELSAMLWEIARSAGTEPRQIGRSRQGRSIESLQLGRGEQHAVVFGLPHPNEPVGGLTTLHLARRLAGGQALELANAFTWHLIPCIDPDGLELNRGWLQGPFTLDHYARHFYRPGGDEQVEWTFPFHYKRACFDTVLPETQALMDVIDRHRPALMCSLHNSELGGTYYYLSRQVPELYPILHEIPLARGLALHSGEPEAAYIEKLDEAIYRWPSAESAYDYAESMGVDPLAAAAGSASSSYAAAHGTLTLVCELPYWHDERAADHRGSGETLDDLLEFQADEIESVVGLMRIALATAPTESLDSNALLRASDYFARALHDVPTVARRRARHPESKREATVAERTSIHDVVHSFRLRYAGMVRRGLKSRSNDQAGAVVDELDAKHETWLAQASRYYQQVRPLPIRDLVATQYGAILATGRQVAQHR